MRARRAGRAERRVLLALLSGAANLSGYVIGHAAGCGPGSVYPVLWRLEDDARVETGWEPPGGGADEQRRKFYRLTPAGRAYALQRLGLDPYTPAWQPGSYEEARVS